VSFTLGLFVGFCLGILCMVLLFQAKASDGPTTVLSATPDEEAHPAHRAINPSEAPSHRSVDR
jgi:hypothetical protein